MLAQEMNTHHSQLSLITLVMLLEMLKKTGVVLGVYQGMINYKSLDADTLHNCLLSNRLDELVHKQYKFRKSGYYKMFCDMNISLKNRFDLGGFPKSQWIELFDDNHCPNCKSEGYITEDKHGGYIDCCRCFKMMCKNCYGKKGICKKCLKV
jgi:hypothetical protein